jgi:hypothetical protein
MATDDDYSTGSEMRQEILTMNTVQYNAHIETKTQLTTAAAFACQSILNDAFTCHALAHYE